MLDLKGLADAIASEVTVEKSAVVLIAGMAASMQTLINNSGNNVDPAALQSLVNQMTASSASLAAAVAANTPAAPVVPVAPPPPPPPPPVV